MALVSAAASIESAMADAVLPARCVGNLVRTKLRLECKGCVAVLPARGLGNHLVGTHLVGMHSVRTKLRLASCLPGGHME